MEKPEYWDFDEEVEEMGRDPDEMWETCERVKREMEAEGHNTDWIGASECSRAARYSDQENRAGYYSSYMPRDGERRTLTLPDEELAVIWNAELVGQISDGAWENTQWRARDGYQTYTDAAVEIQPGEDVTLETDRRVPPRNQVEFSDEVFDGRVADEMQGRMVFFARASGVDDSYDRSDLREDVARLDEMEYV